MKRIQLVSTIAALLLAGPALAGNGHGHGDGHKNKGHGGHDRVVVPVYRDRDDHHRYVRRDWKSEGRHDNGLHLGQHKRWARGQRIPVVYLEPRYYVREYRTYDLARRRRAWSGCVRTRRTTTSTSSRPRPA
jgi:Ni/Co efflux regulator RcnB